MASGTASERVARLLDGVRNAVRASGRRLIAEVLYDGPPIDDAFARMGSGDGVSVAFRRVEDAPTDGSALVAAAVYASRAYASRAHLDETIVAAEPPLVVGVGLSFARSRGSSPRWCCTSWSYMDASPSPTILNKTPRADFWDQLPETRDVARRAHYSIAEVLALTYAVATMTDPRNFDASRAQVFGAGLEIYRLQIALSVGFVAVASQIEDMDLDQLESYAKHLIDPRGETRPTRERRANESLLFTLETMYVAKTRRTGPVSWHVQTEAGRVVGMSSAQLVEHVLRPSAPPPRAPSPPRAPAPASSAPSPPPRVPSPASSEGADVRGSSVTYGAAGMGCGVA